MKLILLVAVLAAVGIVAAIVFNGRQKDEPSAPLSNEQKIKMAQEVLEGKRDPADLEKHGIRLGERKEITPDELSRMAERDRAVSRPATRSSNQ